MATNASLAMARRLNTYTFARAQNPRAHLCWGLDHRRGNLGTGVVIAKRRFDQQPVAWRGPDGQIANTQDKVGALIVIMRD